MTEQSCAHLRVSWRTREVPDTHPTLTEGWWECESHCGAKFIPAKLAASAQRGQATRRKRKSPPPK